MKRHPYADMPVHTRVRVTKVPPTADAVEGEVGIIVHVYPSGDSYEVEFYLWGGKSIVRTLAASYLVPMPKFVAMIQLAGHGAENGPRVFCETFNLRKHEPAKRIDQPDSLVPLPTWDWISGNYFLPLNDMVEKLKPHGFYQVPFDTTEEAEAFCLGAKGFVKALHTRLSNTLKT